MKLTTAAALAFAAASVLGVPVSSKDTVVYARDLYDRSLLEALAGAVGSMGGRVANNALQLEILKKMIPPHRRDLSRRSVARANQAMRSFVGRAPKAGANFHNRRYLPGKRAEPLSFDGIAKGIAARGLEEDALDELD